MLAAVFSFRGRLNRIQYFLGCWGLGTAMVVLVVVGFVAILGGRGADQASLLKAGLAGLLFLLVLGPIYFWVSFSLQARRFRDIGWNPVFVIPAWIGAGILDRLAVMGAPQIAVIDGAGVSWFGLILNLFLAGCLLFWPGRPPFDVAAVFDEVPPPRQPRGPSPSQPQGQPAMARASAPFVRPASPTPAGFGRRGL